MTKKLIAFVGLLAAVALFAPKGAQAATSAELEAQVQALLAQIASLQGGASSASCFGFTRALTVGSQGADVTALQNFLAAKGYFNVAATGYFGAITQASVSAWQAANGVMPAAGYFGPISQAKYNSVCGGVVVNPGTGSGDDDDDDFFSGDDEGSLENFDQMSNLSNEEVGEDEDDVEVLGVEFEADGADQMVERVTVVIDNPSDVAEDDLGDFIQDVSLWLDGDELDRMDVEDASYDRGSDEYTFRFVGLKGIVQDGDSAELTVAVSGPSTVNSDTDGEGWDVEIPSNGIRASSPNGVTETYDGVGPEAFTVETFASANNVELHAKKSSDTPDEQTVIGDDSDSFDADLLAFTLEAEGSDINVFSLKFNLATSSGADVDDLVNSLTLDCGGDQWDENVSGTTTVVFDDLEISIDQDDSLDCTLSAEMNEIDGSDFAEGDTVSANLDVAWTDAEDQSGEGLESGDLTGSANGETQTFRTSGAVLAIDDVSDEAIENNDASTSDNQAEFTIVFTVEATDEDLYVEKTTERGAHDGTPNSGVNYILEDATAGGSATTTGTVSASLTSTADTSGGYFFVPDGETETFTLTVVFDPALTSFYQLQLDSLNFANSEATPTDEQVAAPAEDFETGSRNVLN